MKHTRTILLMYKEFTQDDNLPSIKDFFEPEPYEFKEEILNYLRRGEVRAAQPGIGRDVFTGERFGGGKLLLGDHNYGWTTDLIYYVEKYNMRLPKEFEEYVHLKMNGLLEEYYDKRMKQLAGLDSVEIQNNPHLGNRYHVRIYRNGVVKYSNNIDCKDGAVMFIKPEDAQHILRYYIPDLFGHETQSAGATIIDGYHWKCIFYENNKIIDEMEGWPGEDTKRYSLFSSAISVIERTIEKDMGYNCMN